MQSSLCMRVWDGVKELGSLSKVILWRSFFYKVILNTSFFIHLNLQSSSGLRTVFFLVLFCFCCCFGINRLLVEGYQCIFGWLQLISFCGIVFIILSKGKWQLQEYICIILFFYKRVTFLNLFFLFNFQDLGTLAVSVWRMQWKELLQ